MEIIHDLNTDISEHAEDLLSKNKKRCYKQVQTLTLAHGIAVDHYINSEDQNCYSFAELMGQQNPTKDNCYGFLVLLGVTERNKRKVFQWIEGNLSSSKDEQKTIVAACRAISEMETETYEGVNPNTTIGSMFYQIQDTPEERVLNIFKEVFSKKPIPSSS